MADDVRGMLVGVSVGPGDPELMTLKAVRAIREADVVVAPDTGHGLGVAAHIAAAYLEDKELLGLPMPMTRNASARAAAYGEAADTICSLLDQGRQVAYLCLGDIGMYSSYHCVHELVVQRGYEAQIIPGVTSMSAAAARAGVPLCQGDEHLVVAPLAGADPRELLDLPGNKALVKPGKRLPQLRDELERRGQRGRAVMVEHCGMSDERVSWGLEDAEEAGYLTVTIVPASHDREPAGC